MTKMLRMTEAQLAARKQPFAPAQFWQHKPRPVEVIPPRDMVLDLPWPPSVNRHFLTTGALTKAAKAFREHVVLLCVNARVVAIPGRLAVSITLNPPDARAIDIDNRVKPLLDALQHGGCFPNDAAIDRLVIERGPIVQGGGCRVHITQAGQ